MTPKNRSKRKETVVHSKIDGIISEIESVNPKAAAIVKKRKNLLM